MENLSAKNGQMKKRLVIYSLCLLPLLNSCNSNTQKNELVIKEVQIDSVAAKPIMDYKVVLSNYVDSLNQLKSFDKLPYFLSDSCIDGNTLYWKDLHHAESIRKEIVDKTTNKNLILYIVNNKLFTNKCSSNKMIPYCNFSFYDLYKVRLTELK